MERMNKGESYILFLRKVEDKNQPWYTVEADWKGKIIQRYGAFDRLPEVEKADKALREWQREIKRRLKKEAKQRIEQDVEQQVLIPAM